MPPVALARHTLGLALAAVLIAQLPGCAYAPGAKAAGKPVVVRDLTADLAREGADRLLAQDPQGAVLRLQSALKLRPDAPALHLLLGLSYHLIYLSGGNTFAQAATAYDVALRLDGREVLPHQLRGHLEYAAHNYAAAVEHYTKGLARSNGQDPELLEALMVSAYQVGDIDLAEQVLRRVQKIALSSENSIRLDALLSAIDTGTRGERTRAPVEAPALLRQRYGYGVGEMQAFGRRLRDVEQMSFALAATDKVESAGKVASADKGQASVKADGTAMSAGADKSGGERAKIHKWFECDPEPGFFKPPEQANADNKPANGDETEKLLAIPGVCAGDPPPPVVLFDTTIMRLQEISGSSYGVDFLGALNVFLAGSRTLTVSSATGSPDTRNVASTLSYALGSTPSANYISYALNIANVFGSRNEILSQPSIIAIDRLPSSFFSGSVLTLGISGTAGSASTISDKPIGVSVSVTPTVIDNERLHINVKIARSSLANALVGSPSNSFSQALATNRTSVTTNVTARFGETLVISGLTENETQSGSSGTPILKEIPLLRTLFSQQTQRQSTSSIIVSLTPRRQGGSRLPVEASNRMDKSDLLTRTRLIELAQAVDTASGMDATTRAVRKRTAPWVTREGDLRYQPLRDPNGLRGVLNEATTLAYGTGLNR